MKKNKLSKDFYEKSYQTLGLKAQRTYPNEELCRFLGRNFFHLPLSERKNIKILETGSGAGANLWMIAREGFDTYGIDFSSEAIQVSKKLLDSFQVTANMFTQDMCEMTFDDNFFDSVVDVFSSNCLTYDQGITYLSSIKKLLKPGGLFFSYFPSKTSEAFLNSGNSKLIDPCTLDSITRKDSPFSGQDYPFRFLHSKEYENILLELGFEIQYSEILTRSYNKKTEDFSWCVIEARSK